METKSTIDTNKIDDAITLLRVLSHTSKHGTRGNNEHLTATITATMLKVATEPTTDNEHTDKVLTTAYSILNMRPIKVTRCTYNGQDAVKVRIMM